MIPVMKNTAGIKREKLADRPAKEIAVMTHLILALNPETPSLNPLQAINQEVNRPGEETDQIQMPPIAAQRKVGKKTIGLDHPGQIKRDLMKKIIDKGAAARATVAKAPIKEKDQAGIGLHQGEETKTVNHLMKQKKPQVLLNLC